MSVVGHIQKDTNYNVYTPQLRILGLLQIVVFLVGLVLLAFITLSDLATAPKPAQKTTADLEIKIKDKEIRQVIGHGDTVKLTVSEQGAVDLQVGKSAPHRP
ncbi:MAG: hypothetical protein FJ290_19645 [Planctomycetes bacterium]|nr:hypothetical protein [Planctomycetota bacterium]